MSALRLGRLPDGTRDIRILEPAVGRSSFTRYGIRGSGEYVVAAPVKTTAQYNREARARARNFVDLNTGSDLDNGGVKPSITEVQP